MQRRLALWGRWSLALAITTFSSSAFAEVCDKMWAPSSTEVAMSVVWRLGAGFLVGGLAAARPRFGLVALVALGLFVGGSFWIDHADADIIAHALAEGCGEPIVAAQEQMRAADLGTLTLAVLGGLAGWWRRRRVDSGAAPAAR